MGHIARYNQKRQAETCHQPVNQMSTQCEDKPKRIQNRSSPGLTGPNSLKMCSPSELAEYNKFIGDPELPSGGIANMLDGLRQGAVELPCIGNRIQHCGLEHFTEGSEDASGAEKNKIKFRKAAGHKTTNAHGSGTLTNT
jgi:hypothetical protein